jgi:uncharacterized membrane protein
MFLLDPRAGRARRARARDKLKSSTRAAAAGLEAGVRDFGHRSRGVVARARGALAPSAPDDIIAERVRAELGHASSHPGAIESVVLDGQVRLSGHVLARERDQVVRAVSHVRGVQSVNDELLAHEDAGSIPALQGGEPGPGRGAQGWAPAKRLVAGCAGTGLIMAGRRFRGPARWAAGGVGAMLVARSLLNRSLRRVAGVPGRGVQIHKTIHVNAPVDEVFAIWSDLPAFPRFMTHVREVSHLGEGRYHWKVGAFDWEAEVTRLEPGHLIAWESVPGSQIENAGTVRFEQDGHGGTRVDVQLSYVPPGGSIGHRLAALLGLDPKKQMDDDLIRFKSLLEQGAAGGEAPVVRARAH